MAHTHVIGGTGKGKSKVLQLLLRHDIRDRGCGVCLLDPHGSLYDDIVHDISHGNPRLADRVVLFDPARSSDVVLGWNPIPPDARNNADYVNNMLVGACLKVWGQEVIDKTPRIARWLENWFQVGIDNNLTLVDLLPLLSTTDHFKEERRRLVARVRNAAVIEDFEMFERSNALQRQNLIEGAANRLRKFLRSAPIRNALGQQHNVLDLASIMDEGKILLVNLNGGNAISTDNTKLLGIMLVNELFRVAKLRDASNPRLKPFFLYIDEFANFVTRDVARALEECRKFRMFLTLAHQHLAQLRDEDEYLYASVMTNCHNRIVFGGLSREDAELMADEVMTGHVDLKAVKDEIYTTKVRHEEETRTTVGRSYAESTGHSESHAESQSAGMTEARSTSQSHGQTDTRSWSNGQTRTVGRSDGVTVTEGRTHTEGRSAGQSTGQTVTDGETTGTTTTSGQSWQQSHTKTTGESSSEHRGESGGTSRQEGWSSSESSGESDSFGDSTSQSEGQNVSDGWPASDASLATTPARHEGRQTGRSETRSGSHSSSEGHSGSTTETTGWNEGRSRGRSSSDAETDGQSDSWSEGWQQSRSASRSSSSTASSSRSSSDARSRSTARSHTDSVSLAHSTGQGYSIGRSATQTTGEARSRSRSRGRSTTRATSTSASRSRTETVVPFLRPVEYQELTSRTFYSLAELQYGVMAAIKNQGVGQAVIKAKGSQPQWTSIRRVQTTPSSPALSGKRLATFRDRVIAAHPDCYLPVEEAHRQQQDRQIKVFDKPLAFEGENAPQTVEIKAAPVRDDDDDGSPFL